MVGESSISPVLADALLSALYAIGLELNLALNAVDQEQGRPSIERARDRLDEAIRDIQTAALRSQSSGQRD